MPGVSHHFVIFSQDLAVVVLLILIPLISPNSSKGGVSSSLVFLFFLQCVLLFCSTPCVGSCLSKSFDSLIAAPHKKKRMAIY